MVCLEHDVDIGRGGEKWLSQGTGGVCSQAQRVDVGHVGTVECCWKETQCR